MREAKGCKEIGMRVGLVRVTKARLPEGVLSHHMVAGWLAAFKKDTEKKIPGFGKIA